MPSVLITGAARGIGRNTALRLAGAGWHVIAGLRNVADGERLIAEAGSGIEVLQLDITSAADIAALPKRVPSLDAVVNNAGIVLPGPIEGLPIEDFRRQFEVNVFGQIAATQAVLPMLRASRGRVVFVSSVAGWISTPMTGAYNASKYAIEGLADALRMEVRPWRIGVSLVEPAQTATDMWHSAEDELDAAVRSLTPHDAELYAGHFAGMRRMVPYSQRLATSPDLVAASIEKALTARRPRPRYIVGFSPKVQSAMAGASPTRVRDAVLRRLTGVPGSL